MSIGQAIQNLIEAVQAPGSNAGRISDAKKEIERQFAKKSGSSASKSTDSGPTSEFRDMMGIEQDFMTLAVGNFNNIKQEYKEMYESQAAFIKEGGAYFERFSDGDFKNAFTEMADESFRLFGTVGKIPESFRNLQSTMSSFMMMSDSTRQSLARTTAVAQSAGIETGTFADILDSASLAFGKSGEEVESLANTIATMGQKFGMPAAELARNFRKAQADMAYSSGKIMETFKRLQFTSRTTGVSFDSLTSAFGRSMDTFSGSASKAGTLNAILGRSVFNAVDLLGKTEAERVDTIVKGVKTSIGGDVNKLGKFQLLSVSEGLGLSVEETRKLLSGKTTIDQALKTKEPKDPRERALKAMAEAATGVSGTFDELEGVLRKTRTSFANIALDFGGTQRKDLKSFMQTIGIESPQQLVDLATNMALNAGTSAGDADLVAKQFEAAFSSGDREQMKAFATKNAELINKSSRGGEGLTDANKVTALIEKVAGTGKNVQTDTEGVETGGGPVTVIGKTMKSLLNINTISADKQVEATNKNTDAVEKLTKAVTAVKQPDATNISASTAKTPKDRSVADKAKTGG